MKKFTKNLTKNFAKIVMISVILMVIAMSSSSAAYAINESNSTSSSIDDVGTVFSLHEDNSNANVNDIQNCKTDISTNERSVQSLSENQENLLSTYNSDSGSFSDLDTLIVNGSVNLDKDYKFIDSDSSNYKNGIVISSNVIINGNNHTIDGSNLARIFNVSSTGSLIINNLTLINANVTDVNINGKGGAIYSEGTLTINNSQFINNSASVSGGAIYNDGKLVVNNSQFVNNSISIPKSSTYGGGAILATGTSVVIDNSSFVNNSVVKDGYTGCSAGAVHAFKLSGDANITDSSFDSNNGRWGGAVTLEYAFGNNLIINCNFTNSLSTLYGGGLFVYASNLTLVNSNFTSNKATGIGSDDRKGMGGAVVFISHLSGETYLAHILVDNCNFINNSADSQGGAINLNEYSNTTIKNSYFENNTCTGDNSGVALGGAISIYQNSLENNILNCSFVNNSAPKGGAIYATADLNINNSKFINNSAATHGGAIYSRSSLNINNSIFKSNNVTEAGGTFKNYGGGAIFSSGALIVNNTEFNNNNVPINTPNTSSGDGSFAGAIFVYNTTKNIIVQNSNFTDNEGRHSGAIALKNATCTNTIANCIFENNTAIYGGGIYFDGNSSGVVNSSKFLGNQATGTGSAGAKNGMGGAIVVSPEYGNPTKVQINDCDFINNSADYKGGAIYYCYLSINSTITNSRFINNSVTNDDSAKLGSGGAIGTSAGTINLTIINSVFSGNKAAIGGAIHNRGNLTVINSQFINNSVNKWGGAIYNGANLTVNNSKFNDNSATDVGGAIYDNANLTINNNTFNNNSANHGGAIYLINDDSIIVGINSSEFYNNVAVNGGAIYVGNITSVNVLKSLFSDSISIYGADDTINNIKTYANVASTNPAKITLSNNNFADNTAKDAGGAVYNNAAINLEKNIISNCSAKSGNTIYVDEKGTIDNVNLTFATSVVSDGDNVAVQAYLTDDNGNLITDTYHPVTFTILVDENTNITLTASATDGVATATVSNNDAKKLTNGNYTLTGEYSASKDSTPVEAEVIIVNTKLTADNLTYIFGANVNYSVILSSSEGSALREKVIKYNITNSDGKIVYTNTTVTGSDGSAIVTIPNLDVGNYTINFKFDGDTNNNQTILLRNITVNLAVPTLTINPSNYITTYKGSKINFTAQVTVNNVAVSSGNVIFYVGGSKVANVTIVKGIANYIFESNIVGTFMVKAVYEDFNYESVSKATNVFVISSLSTKISTENISMNVGDNKQLLATLVDQNGVPLKDKNISIVFSNGKSGNYMTDDKGNVYCNLSELERGNYSVIIVYGGDENYTASNANAMVIVGKIASNLTMLNEPISGVSENITVKLVDVNGNPITNASVVLSIIDKNNVSKNYTVLTNAEGIAILPIDLASGNYSVSGIFAGDNKYVESSFKTNISLIIDDLVSNLTASNSTFITNSGENYTIKFTDNYGNPIAGQEIAILLTNALGTSKLYWATTNVEGIAKLKINLAYPGVYNITASFAGDDKYNAIESNGTVTIVNSLNSTVLTADNMNTSSLSGKNFTATLKDNNGTVLPGREVSFTLFNAIGQNKTYWGTTNTEGIAKLPINLAYPSTYYILVNFPGDNNTDVSNTVNATLIIHSAVDPVVYDMKAWI